MCGRMTLTTRDFEEVAALLGVDPSPELAASYRPRFNLPPTDPHLIVVGGEGRRRLVGARWGFGRDPKKPQINARAETVARNGLFKRSFAERRCLVPADGFYEWTGAPGRRRPIWFHAPPGQLLLFAGIYDASGFAVLTTPANDDVAPVHDRMPAILAGEAADRWLEQADERLLRPAPKGALIVTPVSTRASSVANDDEACLAPPGGDDDPRQLRLI
jgi:putative SOS response-associated peptidase YedK